mmetsp:Transcript_18018/g.38498  ORF Transcript_18018/g.38498 Transcript_18018/m.38498 type:complete len:384 (+) Transcript_18018:502-1653(+)
MGAGICGNLCEPPPRAEGQNVHFPDLGWYRGEDNVPFRRRSRRAFAGDGHAGGALEDDLSHELEFLWVGPAALPTPSSIAQSKGEGNSGQAGDGVPGARLDHRDLPRSTRRRDGGGRFQEGGKVDGVESLPLEAGLRHAYNLPQLLVSVACFEGSHEDAADFEEVLQVLCALARASADVDPIVAHAQIDVKLVNIALGEFHTVLLEATYALLGVFDVLLPDVDAIVDAVGAHQLCHQAAEVTRAAADVQKTHTWLQGHKGFQSSSVDVRGRLVELALSNWHIRISRGSRIRHPKVAAVHSPEGRCASGVLKGAVANECVDHAVVVQAFSSGAHGSKWMMSHVDEAHEGRTWQEGEWQRRADVGEVPTARWLGPLSVFLAKMPS